MTPASPDGPVARRVVVSGRVQGVFFRAACRDEARRLGVDGWVRNTPAGTVELWAEGRRAQVDELVRWCREGPGHAEVADVEVYDEAPTGAGPFRVR